MPDFGIDQARGRVIDAMHTGKWDSVDAQLTAYAAAVRADERYRALADALAALQDLGGGDTGPTLTQCLDAVRRLE
jgi:hypothetical protein